VLYHQHAVVLGEAGSGKSVVARRAIELAAEQGRLPIFVPLKAYSADLAALIHLHSSDATLGATDIDGERATRVYIFDGFDEVPADRFDEFVREREHVFIPTERIRDREPLDVLRIANASPAT
jgi:hypothetical protein